MIGDRTARIVELAEAWQRAADVNNIRAATGFAAELQAICRGTVHDSGRCTRCHVTSPNPNGCALCNPEHLGERLRTSLAVIANLRTEMEQSRESWTKTLAARNSRIAELEARIRSLQESYR